MRGGEIALQPAQVEVGVERGDQKGDVHVGRNHLGAALWAASLADEGGPAGQDGVDEGSGFAGARFEGDPVTGDRPACFRGSPEQGAGGASVDLALRRGEPIAAALLDDDPAGLKPLGRMGCEVALERFAPAVGGQQWSCP